MWLYHFWFFWPNSDSHTGYLCAFAVWALSPSFPLCYQMSWVSSETSCSFLRSFSLFSGQYRPPFIRDSDPLRSSDITLDMAELARHGKTARLLSWQRRALCDNKERERATRRKPMAVNRPLCPRHKRAIQRGLLLTQSLGQSAQDAAEQIGRECSPVPWKNKTHHESLWLRLNPRKCYKHLGYNDPVVFIVTVIVIQREEYA